MRFRLHLTVVTSVALAIVALPTPLCAQIIQLGSNIEVGKLFKDVPARPAPRLPDGTVSLGGLPSESGLWLPFHSITERLINPDDIDAAGAAEYPDRPTLSAVPFQPWARALYLDRRNNPFEPHSRCKPSFGPRQFLTPYGVEFLYLPALQRMFIIDEGGPHSFRTIFMDGRSHPKDLVPSYYGHSVGHWEGDTLVVDSRGFNEGFWLDRSGLPHTQQLHTTERFTRTDSKTIKYKITIDDPGAYTATWTSGFDLGWDPEDVLFEYICQDNNLADDLLVGAQESVDRRTLIVP